MRILKKIVIFLALVLGAITLVGFLLPGHYLVRRDITILAPPGTIYPFINRLSRWPEWSPWTTNVDPTIVYTYTGPAEGKGAVSSWQGQKLGEGTMKLTASEPGRGIDYELAFNKGKHRSHGVIHFEPVTNGTRVIWTNEGELGANPINRYFGLLMEKLMAPDFEAGLAKLKLRAEAR